MNQCAPITSQRCTSECCKLVGIHARAGAYQPAPTFVYVTATSPKLRRRLCLAAAADCHEPLSTSQHRLHKIKIAERKKQTFKMHKQSNMQMKTKKKKKNKNR